MRNVNKRNYIARGATAVVLGIFSYVAFYMNNQWVVTQEWNQEGEILVATTQSFNDNQNETRVMYLVFENNVTDRDIEDTFARFINTEAVRWVDNLSSLGTTQIKDTAGRQAMRDWSRSYVIEFPNSVDVESIKNQLKTTSGIALVEVAPPMVLFDEPNDPKYDEQRHLKDFEMVNVWDMIDNSCLTPSNVQVGVIDNGIEVTHSDLATNMLNSVSPGSHGTHVAGIVSAVTDNTQWVAALPNNTAKIHGYKWLQNWVSHLNQAVSNGDKIVNMSFGCCVWWPSCPVIPWDEYHAECYDPFAESVITAATNAWVVIVAAAGNSDAPYAAYPAHYEGVIGVGALKEDGSKASFSNYGEGVDVMVPWVSILSTCVWWWYCSKSGTSMSSPFMVSIIALQQALWISGDPVYFAQNVKWNVEAHILNTCGSLCGNGILEWNEACDDGNLDNDDGCDASCAIELQDNWDACTDDNECISWNCEETITYACVSGAYGEKLSCPWFTTQVGCEWFQQNVGPGWALVSVCTWQQTVTWICTASCGNGIVEDGEACDDGNTTDSDECGNDCTQSPTTCEYLSMSWCYVLEWGAWVCCGDMCFVWTNYCFCGDGIVNGAEECDGSDTNNGAMCSSSCKLLIGQQEPELPIPWNEWGRDR